MKNTLIIFVFLFGSLSAFAQSGKIEIITDARIDQLIEKHIYLNEHQSTLEGWRVQIFFDSGANSKRRASDALNRFTALFPETQAYLSFKEPYYRVRVGDFRTRLEAEGFMNTIQAEYPNAFAVADMINPPPIDQQ